MKGSELRIGNLVYSDEYGNVLNVNIEHFILLDKLKPIPLTEDWLLKFGGQKIGECTTHASYKVGGLIIMWRWTGCFVIDLGQIEVNGEFVHEFQNLYFVLTGEEL